MSASSPEPGDSNDASRDSDAGSDSELENPSQVLDPSPRKSAKSFAVDDVVWASWSGMHWPAKVVRAGKQTKKNKTNATVLWFGDKEGKEYPIKSTNLTAWGCPEKQQFIEAGRKSNDERFDSAVAAAFQYICSKAAGAGAPNETQQPSAKRRRLKLLEGTITDKIGSVCETEEARNCSKTVMGEETPLSLDTSALSSDEASMAGDAVDDSEEQPAVTLKPEWADFGDVDHVLEVLREQVLPGLFTHCERSQWHKRFMKSCKERAAIKKTINPGPLQLCLEAIMETLQRHLTVPKMYDWTYALDVALPVAMRRLVQELRPDMDARQVGFC